jgi:hypothetical protein
MACWSTLGIPTHEDDAERAVRAALELVRAVGDLKTHAALQTRVGIATGLVVVGDLIGSGASQEQAIVGETPNLAARLQGIAEPNSVVIAESTRKLLGNLFELEDLGAKNLKGVEGSVRAWAALRPSLMESRFEALHASGVTGLVGREEELEILVRRWSKAGPAKVKWCYCLVSRALASLDSPLHCSNGLPRSRTGVCVTSARRSTPTVPCTRSSAKLNALRGSRTTIMRKRS